MRPITCAMCRRVEGACVRGTFDMMASALSSVNDATGSPRTCFAMWVSK
ncbi:MAG: hypothetical protein ACHREM_15465 [Polyangiales bacterium]